MKYFFLVMFLLCSIAVGRAQQLPVTVYSPGNGTFFSGANSVFQDQSGWMWFTNSYDVVRYDGHTFKVYPPVSGQKFNFCYAVLKVKKEIWALTNPRPMVVNGDSLAPLVFRGITPKIISHVVLNGTDFFLGENGLFRYSEKTFEHIVESPELEFGNGETIHPFGDSLLISFKWRNSFLLLNPYQGTFHTFPMAVNAIRQDTAGKTYLLLQGQGIVQLEGFIQKDKKIIPQTKTIFNITESKAEQFELDGQGNIWIGVQDNYLMKITPNRSIQTYTESDRLPSLWFYELFRDREDNIWIAMNNGLCKIMPSNHQRFTKDQGLYSNYTSFICKGPGRNHIYIGTYSGVNVIVKDKVHALQKNDQPFVCQHMIFEGIQTLFVRDSAFFSAQIDTVNYEIKNEHLLATLPGKGLYLARDSVGTIFIATTHGLFAWHQNRLTKIIPENRHYHTLMIDAQQRLWTGEFAGNLNAYSITYSNTTLKANPVPIPPVLQSQWQEISLIRALALDSHGNVFAGTRYNGLFFIELEENNIASIRHWNESTSLSSNSIWGIAPDPNGGCWAASSKGLSYVNTQTGMVKDEGITARIYQATSVLLDDDQSIWIGSHPGIVHYKKESIPSLPFSTFLTNIKNNGQSVFSFQPPIEKMIFAHDQNMIEIEFSANTFNAEEDVQYSYRLLQNDKGDWSALKNMHSVTYPSLSPGEYIFQVRAKNSHGTWSTNTAEWTFKINPPFWQRSWFLICLAGGILGIAYAVYKYRIRQIMALQQMRNTISRNLHDDIGASLSNIHILNALTLRHLDQRPKAENYLQQAGEDIQQISESLSDIVWNINPMYDNLDHLISHMKRYAADMLEGKNIEAVLQFPSPGNKMHLPMDLRRDVFLIFKEAIHNLIKYSKATYAEVLLKEEQHHLFLVIKDNGIGFNPSDVTVGNGLVNMKTRASAHNAYFQITSAPGEGTMIELRIKLR